MDKIKSISIVLIICMVVVLLASCSPSGSQIQTAVQQTQTVWTPVPTQTELPTNTAYPTYTLVPTYTVFPTYTPFSTYTPPPTIAVEVTRIVMVTPTETATPLYTDTVTPTPTNTETLEPTVDETKAEQTQVAEYLHSDKEDGFYLVNEDIAPGVWRSTGTGNKCYWEITTKTGDIINNFYGMSGGTIYISPSAYQVQLEGCGTWKFLSKP